MRPVVSRQVFLWAVSFLTLTLTPVIEAQQTARFSGRLASAICGATTEHSITSKVQSALRDGERFPSSLEPDQIIKWTQCSQGCDKFVLTTQQSSGPEAETRKSSQNPGKTKILGGQDTTPHEFPWVIRIKTIGPSPNQLKCSGSLYKMNYVITAADCINKVSPFNIQLIAGDHSIKKDDGKEQLRTGSSATKHESWTEDKPGNNIAIVKLTGTFVKTPFVSTIDLTDKDPEIEGMVGTVTGWGLFDHSGDNSDTLMKVDVPIMDHVACISSSVGDYPSLRDYEFCTNSSNGQGVCEGDAGGGFILQNEMKLSGIVARSKGCGAEYPVVFTNIFKYKDWIEAKTK